MPWLRDLSNSNEILVLIRTKFWRDMYLLNELILFSPLIFYSFFRIGRLPRRRAARVSLAVFFAFLSLGYPVAETLSHNASTGWFRHPMGMGYCALPFLLYMVLTVVLFDLILGILVVLRLIPRKAFRGSGYAAVQLCFFLVTPAAIVVAGVVNNDRLQIREYSVEVPRRSSSIRGLKIVFASDFHLGAMTSDGLLERFVAKVQLLNPDLILIGGDVLEGDRGDLSLDECESRFRQLKARYGFYAVSGNHEMHGESRSGFFERSGIRLLEDNVVEIERAFCLAGRKDGRDTGRRSVQDLLQKKPDDLPVVMLDHRPVDLDSVSRADVDLLLSGHTHHGQLFPVNFVTGRQYELSWGFMKKRNTHIIVTSGTQVWGPPVRTVGSSEIVVINVTFDDLSSATTEVSRHGSAVHSR